MFKIKSFLPVAPLLTAGLLVLGALTALNAQPALQAVPELNLNRYQGQWYQVALYPNRFQKQCVRKTVASYSLNPDGSINVQNSCTTAEGKTDLAQGQARPTGASTLQVSFLPSWLRWTGIGWGNYWVIQLGGTADEGYRYAVVSEPGRQYLWVLSRKPELSAEDNTAIRAQLKAQGFDLDRLQAHPQN